jgi:dTDP-4-dehydrorhamnose 3,5-epimerase
MMLVSKTTLDGVLLIEPRVFGDDRGHFFESFNEERFHSETGLDVRFVQDNQSRSVQHVLRGLHYQVQQPQGKLVRVLAGRIFDVCVDLRRSSPDFGRWLGLELTADSKRAIWVPPGFAHGFLTLSAHADVFYKTTDYYAPAHERTIVWNDADLRIEWPLAGEPTLSAKDRAGRLFQDAELA